MKVIFTTIVAKGYASPPLGIMALASYVQSNCADLGADIEVKALPFRYATPPKHIALNTKLSIQM